MSTSESAVTDGAAEAALHPTQRQVLDVLRAAAGPDSRAMVSNQELAAATGRPYRTVQYTVHTLVRDGHIEVVDHVGPRLRRVVRILTREQ